MLRQSRTRGPLIGGMSLFATSGIIGRSVLGNHFLAKGFAGEQGCLGESVIVAGSVQAGPASSSTGTVLYDEWTSSSTSIDRFQKFVVMTCSNRVDNA